MVFVCFLGPTGCLAWIFGHSFVYRGAFRADAHKKGRQLGFDKRDLQVRWIGLRGMLWSRVLPELRFYASFDRYPDLLVLHAGGNDMSVRASRDVIRDIKQDLLCLWSLCPKLIVIWSDIVARRTWREARSVERVNKARVKVNQEVGRFVKRNGGIVVRHKELEGSEMEFVDNDGVHLTPIGMDLWTLNLQEGLKTAWEVWRDGRQ